MLVHEDSLHNKNTNLDSRFSSEYEHHAHTSASSPSSSTVSLLEMKEAFDAEAQSSQTAAAEHYVSTRSKFLVLAAYFMLNLFLTLSNKNLLGTVSVVDLSHSWWQIHILIHDRPNSPGFLQQSTAPRLPSDALLCSASAR